MSWWSEYKRRRDAEQAMWEYLSSSRQCKDWGGSFGRLPYYECELVAGHTGIHKGGPFSWDR